MLLVLLMQNVLANYSYYVNFGEVKKIFDIPDALEASLFQIDDDNQIVQSGMKFCFLVDRQINTDGQTYILDQKYYDQEDPLSSTDFVVDIAMINFGFVVLTQNGYLYHITDQSIKQIQKLSIENNELIPQLLSHQNYLLIAYADSGYLVNILDKIVPNQIQTWKQRQIRYYTQIMNNFIFSALGSEGLEIYYILDNNIQFMNSVEANNLGLLAIDFRDFSIMKVTDKKYLLYVLCKKNGVLVIEMTAIKDQVTFKLLLKYIGPKTEGIAIDLFDEDSVFVAYKANRSYFLIRYRIDGYNKKWSSNIRYNITHKIIDIDVNQYFVLVQGTFKHHLIYYTEQQKPIPFIFYGVKQFILVDSFIVGTTSRFVFNVSSLIEPYQIKCYSDSDQSILEQKYKLMYRTNQSWRQLEFKVYFNKEDNQLSGKILLAMLFTLLSIILVSIIIFYLKRLRTQNNERENLEKKIHSLPQNRASKLIMPHTFRLVTSAEYRVNTYNNTEDTIVSRDRKEQ